MISWIHGLEISFSMLTCYFLCFMHFLRQPGWFAAVYSSSANQKIVLQNNYSSCFDNLQYYSHSVVNIVCWQPIYHYVAPWLGEIKIQHEHSIANIMCWNPVAHTSCHYQNTFI